VLGVGVSGRDEAPNDVGARQESYTTPSRTTGSGPRPWSSSDWRRPRAFGPPPAEDGPSHRLLCRNELRVGRAALQLGARGRVKLSGLGALDEVRDQEAQQLRWVDHPMSEPRRPPRRARMSCSPSAGDVAQGAVRADRDRWAVMTSRTVSWLGSSTGVQRRERDDFGPVYGREPVRAPCRVRQVRRTRPRLEVEGGVADRRQDEKSRPAPSGAGSFSQRIGVAEMRPPSRGPHRLGAEVGRTRAPRRSPCPRAGMPDDGVEALGSATAPAVMRHSPVAPWLL